MAARSLREDMREIEGAIAVLPVEGVPGKPITVIGTRAIREQFDETCLQQAVNSRRAPGVTDIVLNPDAHLGFGAPVGCVLVSPTHVYPGPVGVDIKCSMSLLQLDLPEREIQDRKVRRQLIREISQRIPTGVGRGEREAPKSRRAGTPAARRAVVEGASAEVCKALGIPPQWAERCEDSHHFGHDGTRAALDARLEEVAGEFGEKRLTTTFRQLGSYGGGNHFGEGEVVRVVPEARAQEIAAQFGLIDGGIAFLSHCGSRGFGHDLAQHQFRSLQALFAKRKTPLPAGDRELVFAELETPEANRYLDDMALGANFATLNHLLINALVLEAFQEVLPGVQGRLVYFISHNIARREQVDGRPAWVHRKGATRAFPAGHPELKTTPFAQTGHPILLPGNPLSGSAVMVAEPGASLSRFSVNHGAGRALGRRNAIRTLDQAAIDRELAEADVLTNCRSYPRDEAPAAYKSFEEVLRSVKEARLAREVARLQAKFVLKDGAPADD